MVQGVAHVVGDNFLDLELVSPDIDRLICINGDRCPLVLDEEFHPGYHAFYQLNDIKALHSYLVISELELVQCEKLSDHVVHFRRFIYYDIAVEVSALLILSNVVLQTFGIARDQGNRRLQLMGDIVQELLAHLIDLGLALIVFLQLDICRLELTDRLLKLVGHDIEILSELIDLVVGMAGVSDIKIQFRHLAGQL